LSGRDYACPAGAKGRGLTRRQNVPRLGVRGLDDLRCFVSSALLLHRFRELATRTVEDVNLGHVFEIEPAYQIHCPAAVRTRKGSCDCGHGQLARRGGDKSMNGTVPAKSSLLPPTRGRTNQRYPHIDIRRLHTTIRFGCGGQENAQNIPARSDPHHIAQEERVLLGIE
jgi:hypothetical protein